VLHMFDIFVWKRIPGWPPGTQKDTEIYPALPCLSYSHVRNSL
jgi:hypothetical protein